MESSGSIADQGNDADPMVGFDQTNSLAGNLHGESGGMADGESQSAADRGADDPDLADDDAPPVDPAGPAILRRTLGEDNEV